MSALEGRMHAGIYESYKSKVEVFEAGGRLYTRKTYKTHFVFGVPLHFIPRYLCSREVDALERVRGVEGVQQIVERDSDYSFVSAYSEGTPLKRLKEVPKGAIGKLEMAVELMHSRGVADLDLGNRTDIIIDERGNPTLIDIDSAITYSGTLLNRMLFHMACRLNRRKLIRMKMNYCPETLIGGNLQEAGKSDYIEIVWRKFKEALRFVKYDVCGLKKPEEIGYVHGEGS